MVKYTCSKCLKDFKQKGHYTRHINRKYPCTNRVIGDFEKTEIVKPKVNSYEEITLSSDEKVMHAPIIMDRTDEIAQRVAKIKFDQKKTLNLKIDRGKGTASTTFFIGASKAGKSTLMMHLWKKHYSRKSIISTLFSENSQISLYKGRKDLLKCDAFNDKAKKYIKMEKHINTKTGNKYEFVNLFDDIVGSRHNKLLMKMVLSYRNSRMHTLFCTQYSNLIDKATRGNINNILLFNMGTDENTEVVIETFLKSTFKKMGLRNMTEMVLFYRRVTADYGFIYVQPRNGKVSFHKIPYETLKKK